MVTPQPGIHTIKCNAIIVTKRILHDVHFPQDSLNMRRGAPRTLAECYSLEN
jgi:hypothetical protein